MPLDTCTCVLVLKYNCASVQLFLITRGILNYLGLLLFILFFLFLLH